MLDLVGFLSGNVRGGRMSTTRVPGITRNSGWQAIDAEIVEARELRQRQNDLRCSEAESRANGAARQVGEAPR